MANGDAAAAKGWETVPESDDVKVGYDEINYSRDLVALEQDRALTAEALKFDAAKVIITPTTPTVVNGAIWLKPLS